MRAYYKQQATQQNNTGLPAEQMLAGLLQALVAPATQAMTMHNARLVQDVQTAGAGLTANDLQNLKQQDPDNVKDNRPKAHLNYVFFDKQFKFVSDGSGIKQVDGEPNELETLSSGKVVAKKNGYVYVYTSNESQQDVFFDNLGVEQITGPVLEETHYYPFGLTMSAISAQAFGGIENKYRYNGKELQDELGLNWYDYGARQYDMQIGRWTGIDALANKMPGFSPYSYAFDNPVKFIDIGGQFPFPVTVRSFAPPRSFSGRWGMRFADDNRGFSANLNATSRISQTYTVDSTKRTISGGRPVSSDTRRGSQSWNATNTTDRGRVDNAYFSKNSFGSDVASVEAHFKGSNPAFHGLAPDIAVNSTVTLSENDKKGYVIASVDLSSKQFPATEAIIADTKGQSVLLVGAAAYGDPSNLMNADIKDAASIDIRLNINDKGEFTGVQYGGKTYSITDWNKMQGAKPAGPFSRDDKDKIRR